MTNSKIQNLEYRNIKKSSNDLRVEILSKKKLKKKKEIGKKKENTTSCWTKIALGRVKALPQGRNSALVGSHETRPPPAVVESRRLDRIPECFTRVGEERQRERGHLDDCVRWKGRGTGVRRGCVHGLTIGNQTPFNALPSLQRVDARSFFRIRRIPSIFRPAWVWVYRVRHVKPRNDSIFPETIAARRSISFENCCITFEKFK